MHTLELTAAELRLVAEALEAYLAEFGHDEADTERLIKSALARVRAAAAASRA